VRLSVVAPVDGVMALSHLVADGLTLADEDTHRPQFLGPGTPFTFGCRITAAQRDQRELNWTTCA
jgi:hypothetical protein